jgi:modification methylase
LPEQLPVDQILEGDCVEILNGLPENSVDLIFADPPYFLQLQRELWRPNQTRVDAVDDAWDHFNSFSEYDDFTRAWLSACYRILKETGTIWVIGTYHNIYRVGAILQDLGYWILNDVVWIKTNPMPNFRGVRFTNAHETLIWARKLKGPRYTFNHHTMKALNDDLQMRSDWYLPLCTGKERIKVNGTKAHATQKPQALLYRVIMASSNPGDIVLDPFFGTGTTGAVAKQLQRHWIGIERDPQYIRIAQERLEMVQPDVSIDHKHHLDDRRSQPRIPFGTLLERGMLQPGQTLYFGKEGELYASVLANGYIRYDGMTGSIHQVAKMILGGPANGWDYWYVIDEDSGERVVIDRLRQKVREEFDE